MVIVDLAAGKATRIDRVKRFAMPEKAPGLLAYLKEGPDAPADGGVPATAAGGQTISRAAAADAAVRRRRAAGRASEFGTDLVLRTLADGAERTFADVVEFLLPDDGRQLVYAVGARDTAKNGVFAAKPGDAGRAGRAAGRQRQVRQAHLGRKPDAAGLPERPRRRRGQTAEVEALPLGPPVGGRGGTGRRRDARLPQGIRGQRQGHPERSPRTARACSSPCAPPPPEKKDPVADAPPTTPRRWWTCGATKTTTCSRFRRCAPSATATARSRPRT